MMRQHRHLSPSERAPEYEFGLIFKQPPEPVPANLLNYPSFFEMGQTARSKLEVSKRAQKEHRRVQNKLVSDSFKLKPKSNGNSVLNSTAAFPLGNSPKRGAANIKLQNNTDMLNLDLLNSDVLLASPAPG